MHRRELGRRCARPCHQPARPVDRLPGLVLAARRRQRRCPRGDPLHGGRVARRREGARIEAGRPARRVEAVPPRLGTGADLSQRELVLLEELSSTREELRVVQEDMQEQTEHLLEMRHTLEVERRRYAELFDLAPDAYLVTDSAGVVIEANRGAGTLLGLAPQFLVGKPLAGFVAADQRRAFRRQLLDLMHVTDIQSLELALVRRGGSGFPAAATVAVARNVYGEPVGLRWILRDVPAEREAERATLDLNVALERRVAERTAELETVYQAHERERSRLRRLLERLPEGVVA